MALLTCPAWCTAEPHETYPDSWPEDCYYVEHSHRVVSPDRPALAVEVVQCSYHLGGPDGPGLLRERPTLSVDPELVNRGLDAAQARALAGVLLAGAEVLDRHAPEGP